MKRLVKKAEFFNAIHNRVDKYIEVYKNPNRDEFNLCKDQNEYKSVRIFIDFDGNVFTWDMEGLHDEVVDGLSLGKGFKCELTDNTFEITVGAMNYLEEVLKDTFLEAKNVLDEIDVSNCSIRWDSYLSATDTRIINNLKTVNDIYSIEIKE
jgi:hypothetical protein